MKFKKLFVFVFTLFVILCTYYVFQNVSTQVILFDDNIVTSKNITILDYKIYSTISSWNLGNDFTIKEGVIYYTKLNKQTDYIPNVSTGYSPVYVTTAESNDKLNFINFISDKEQKLTKVNIFLMSSSSQQEIFTETLSGYCFINNLKALQIFCKDSEMKALQVYNLVYNDLNLYSIEPIFSIENFDSNQLYKTLKDYIIVENKDYSGSCIYNRQNGQKTCIAYPELSESEILEILEFNNIEAQYLNEFTFQSISVFENKHILIFGSAWRFGGGAYWLYDIENKTYQMLKSESNTFFLIQDWIYTNNVYKSDIFTNQNSAYQFSFTPQDLSLIRKELINFDYVDSSSNLLVSQNKVYFVDNNLNLILLEPKACIDSEFHPFVTDYTNSAIIHTVNCDRIQIHNKLDSGIKVHLLILDKEEHLNIKDIFY